MSSRISRVERYNRIIEWFEREMPVVQTELMYSDPFQLAVAVILSAQCTDKRVNIVTKELFNKYPTPEAMAQAGSEQIFQLISSVTYPNSKSKHLSSMAKMVVDVFSSRMPEEPSELMRLPGIGRKSANVIASVVYNKPVIAVDTHVFRVSRRLGLSEGKDPLSVEKDLTENIPEEKRAKAHHWLILHGRYICVARKPRCSVCGLKELCLYYHISGR